MLGNNIMRIFRSRGAIASASYSLASQGTLATINKNSAYKAAVIVVTSISSEAVIVAHYNSPVIGMKIYNEYGLLIPYFSSVGRYYLAINGESDVTIRNEVAVTGGSVTFSVTYLNEFPESLLFRKPIQLIGQKTVEINSLSKITVFAAADIGRIVDFKYYFFSYFVRNGTSAAARKLKVDIQPYHYFPFSGSLQPGLSETIVDEQNTYSYQSEWQKVRGDAIRVFVQSLESAVTEGDTLYFNIYGIR